MVKPLLAEKITKHYGKEEIFTDLIIRLDKGETLSIVGRSGCGKTTLLKILAGLEQPDKGRVLVSGTEIQALSTRERGVVYLYQEPLLFPHLNVFENIAFGLRLRNVREETLQKRTRGMIELLQLNGMSKKMPNQLSGGQKQRVSFGRALITDPKVLLLDEPFGSLDADTRRSMQELFTNIAKKLNLTSVFVTHNTKEAILMGDRFGSMANGDLTTFSTLKEFINSGQNGINEEIEFWKSIDKKY